MTKNDENRQKSGSTQPFSEMLAQASKDAAKRESPRMPEPIGFGFSKQPQEAEKPEDTKNAPPEEGFTLKQFAAWSVVVGVVIVPVVLWADIARYALFIPALLIVFGALLFFCIRGADEFSRMAENALAQTKKNLSEEQRNHEKSLESARRQHEEELKSLRQQNEKETAELRGGMLAEIQRYQREAEALARNLRKEKTETQELGSELSDARKTLDYYSKYEWLDAYVGEAALHEYGVYAEEDDSGFNFGENNEDYDEDDSESRSGAGLGKIVPRKCGGIYVVSNPADGKVKIGMTDDFARRFKEIQSACKTAGIAKVVPEILVPLDEGKYAVEQGLHIVFAENKTAGEWFKIPPKKAIASVLAEVSARRIANFKERKKIPVTKEGDNPAVRFGVNWETVPPELAAIVATETAEDGTTALQMARKYSKNPKVIEAMVKAKADANLPIVADSNSDINLEDNDGWAPLHVVAWNGSASAITALAAAGADVNLAAKSGDSPLHLAVQGGHSSVVAALVKAGADVNLANINGWAPLHLAAGYGHTAAIRYLIKTGADINHANKNGWIPLHNAAKHGHADAIAVLAEAGADVNCADEDGRTPLSLAAKEGHATVITALAEAGTDVNHADEYSWTPLDLAAEKGHVAVIIDLAEAGADVNRADEDGCTSLHVAVQHGNTNAIFPLVAAGANINRIDKDGWTPLDWAASEGNADAVIALTKAGAAVNPADEDDCWTSLHLAAQKGHSPTITALVEAGADVHLKNEDGKTAADIAEQGHGEDAEVTTFLRKQERRGSLK